MIKAILFDIDGVLIRLPYYHSRVLSENGYENAKEVLDEFYTGEENNLRNTGFLDASVSIIPYLKRIGWNGTANNFLENQYDFEKGFLDLMLIEKIRTLRSKGIFCALATDQNTHRANYLLERLDFEKIFDDYFISCKLGYRKVQKEYWEIIIEHLKKRIPFICANELLFVDDMKCNIDMAKTMNINAFLINDETDIYCALKDI